MYVVNIGYESEGKICVDFNDSQVKDSEEDSVSHLPIQFGAFVSEDSEEETR